MQLKMEPVSSSSVPPTSDKSVTQIIIIDNPKKVGLCFYLFRIHILTYLQEPIRLRYKVNYEQFGVEMEQSGTWHQHITNN
jgi:hypothetical protein